MPQVDLNSSYMTADGYSETGGSAALTISGINETIFGLVPVVEIGTYRRFEDGGVLRAFARLGTSLYSKGGVDVTSRLASDDSGVEGFTIGSGGDTQVWNITAGITAFQISGWSTEARVNLSLGDDTKDHQASLKLRKTF